MYKFSENTNLEESRYAMIEKSIASKNAKRKGVNGTELIKPKKLKLCKDSQIKIPTNAEQTQKKKNPINKSYTQEKNIPEDLLQARKALPVYSVRYRLIEEIKKHHTMIVLAETGSGKTTQIPQLIHEHRLESVGSIVVTQPRRVAAITIAQRVAAEMNTQIGSIVGYSVRFEDVTSQRTKVKYSTDGMLLREAINDPLLTKYSFVILDEAHERTINTDILFGIVKLAQQERSAKNINPLKVIIMSATMDVDPFRKYFDNCPVIYLEGRAYPVNMFYLVRKQDDYQYAAVCTVFQLHSTTPSDEDFLVFLTGQEEIENVMHSIIQIAKETPGPPIKVCPLYAGLPPAKQLQVWKNAPEGTRKVVLATNIAEASVTIPSIKCVIDTGVVKERTWCTATGAERLRVRPVAQSAAWQRAGRAGRTGPGACYRLYTDTDFAARPKQTTPEIVRCPLTPTTLMLVAAGRDPTTFPLMDAPPQESIKASLSLLKELGAIDSVVKPKLTPIGKKMATFPIDPKFARILINAPEYNCLEEALSLVAVLSSENVFYSPANKRGEALMAKEKFLSPLGDHITLLTVFKAFCSATLKKQWCRENYLNHKNLSYACEVRHQLLTICQRLQMPMSSCGTDYDQLLKCVLSGVFTHCAWLRTGGDGAGGGAGGGGGGGGGRYATCSGAAATVHPGSALYLVRPPPPALLYTELLHTTRLYMLTASAIQPHWLDQVAPAYARRCRLRR